MNPQKVNSKIVHDGWLQLRVDSLQYAGSDTLYQYDVVHVGDGVAILPFLDDNTLLLAKSYRYPIGETLLECIQGGMKKGESIIESAARELLEETGYAGTLTYTNTMYPLPGSLDMRLHLLKATDLQKIQEPKLDEFEHVEIIVRPYLDVLEEIKLEDTWIVL